MHKLFERLYFILSYYVVVKAAPTNGVKIVQTISFVAVFIHKEVNTTIYSEYHGTEEAEGQYKEERGKVNTAIHIRSSYKIKVEYTVLSDFKKKTGSS